MDINEIKTPKDIFEFMSENIKYGWLDVNGKIHVNEMNNIRNLHRIISIEDTIYYGVGTCVEQAYLISYLLNKINIPNKLFCIRRFESSNHSYSNEQIYMHCFVLYYYDNKVFQLEYPNPIRRGFHEYYSEEEAIKEISDFYSKKENGIERIVTEFFEVKPNWSFNDFNNYINDLDDKNIKKYLDKNQLDNEMFSLYSPDSLKYVTNGIESYLTKSLNLYKKLFGITTFRKVQINYFDDLSKFRRFIHSLRRTNTLPEYATGTFDRGMINAYVPKDLDIKSSGYLRKKYLASHELFHIIYKEEVYAKNDIPRIVWFDEGMAMLFSGERNDILRDENYESFLKEVKNQTKIIPNLNELSHGNSFKNKDYDGYNLSLIAVKNIYDKLGLEEFRKLLYNVDKIRDYGNTIITEIFKEV